MSNSGTPSASLRAILRPIARTSLAIALLFLGGFGVWAAYAPLSSAAIAPGVVSPDSRRQTVQHLEGGIVQESCLSSSSASPSWSASSSAA